MAKNILQDIVPPERRSIRNIPVPPRRNGPAIPPRAPAPAPRPLSYTREERVAPLHNDHEETFDDQINEEPKVYSYESKASSIASRFSGKRIWAACGVAILIVVFAFSALSNSAVIKITPHTKTVQAEGVNFNAFQGAGDNGVPYEIVKISKDMGATVNATGEENVSSKASGSIIIYNTTSKASQRLIKNTRFETPEGLIYRINDSVVVPGTSQADGKTVPGSVEVTVYADEAGDKYNIGLKDFTIPGFKGDPRFTTMYARSKTEIAGGFVGVKKKIAPSDLSAAQKSLDEELKNALMKEVGAQIPADFVAYSDGMIVTFEPLPQSNAKDNTVQVNERGTLSAIIFNKNLLARYLAMQLAPDLATSSVMVSNINDLGFSMQNKSTFNPTQETAFTFTVSGDISFVSQFDQGAFVKSLLGKPKSSLSDILSDYQAIDKADVVLRPFWKKSFPTNEKNITVTILSDQ